MATGTNLSDYTVVYNNGTLTVGQATLTVTAANANRTYGAANPTFSASAAGAVNGDTFTLTETTTATASSPVGTYPIVPVATGTNLSDYTVVYNNGTLTVGQATLTVTAANATRTYGAANPTFSASAAGAVNGDTFTLTESTTATAASPVGTYPIVPVATGTNLSDYNVVYNNGTLTVGQATLTVTAANANRTYGAANPIFSASATGAVNGDTFTFTESTIATATSPVGTYPIVPVATGTNLSDYTVVYNNGTLTVGQATLTVTAANASRVYGVANPTFSASAAGAVNGDTFTFTESTPATTHIYGRNVSNRSRSHRHEPQRLRRRLQQRRSHHRPGHSIHYLGQPRTSRLRHRPWNRSTRRNCIGPRFSGLHARRWYDSASRQRHALGHLHPNRLHRLHHRHQIGTADRQPGHPSHHMGESCKHRLRHRPEQHSA